MADKDKIKAELELRIKRLERANAHPEVIKRVEGSIKAYKSMIEFIDSMEDEVGEYERGCKETKEQMMANAIEAEVQSAGCFIPLITPKEYGDKIPNIKFGDTIKVILVKE